VSRRTCWHHNSWKFNRSIFEKGTQMIHHARYQVTTSPGCPATRALASLDDQIPARETQKVRRRTVDDEGPRQTFSKRQCTHYDMTDIISALKPLEQSYGFPSIEWSYDDECFPSNNDFREHKHTNTREGVSFTVANEVQSISKDLHRCSSSESLSRSGKEAQGRSLVRAKSKTSCLVSLESFRKTKPSTPARTEGSNRLASRGASWVLGPPPVGEQRNIP
jgi:hypothetical protein